MVSEGPLARARVVELGQLPAAPCVPIHGAADLAGDRHIVARDVLEEIARLSPGEVA